MKNPFYYLTNHLNNVLHCSASKQTKFLFFPIWSLSSLLFNRNINNLRIGADVARPVFFFCHRLTKKGQILIENKMLISTFKPFALSATPTGAIAPLPLLRSRSSVYLLMCRPNLLKSHKSDKLQNPAYHETPRQGAVISGKNIHGSLLIKYKLCWLI